MAQFKQDLRDSVVVVLGASSGFGHGAAIKLAQEGARVVLAARRDDLLTELEAEIRAAGGDATAVPCDISQADQVAAVARAALDRHGRIDVWIKNVGVGALGFFWDIPIEDQARVIDVNLKGLMFGAHAGLTQFRAQGYGVLVNTGSIDSEVPLALQTTYAATKAAVLSLSRSLNKELALVNMADAIRVATIMPWAVDAVVDPRRQLHRSPPAHGDDGRPIHRGGRHRARLHRPEGRDAGRPAGSRVGHLPPPDAGYDRVALGQDREVGV